jgi:hypothetical protein
VVAHAGTSCAQVSVTTELHGHSIFQGKEDWSGMAPRARIAIYDQAMQAIARHDVEIYIRGVHRARLVARYAQPLPAHDVALQHLLERIDESATEPVLVIADEVHEHDRTRHRINLREFRRSGTPGYRSSRLTKIVDALHYTDSRHSRLIQAIDLVTFLYVRRQCVSESDPRAKRANDLLWSRVQGRVRTASGWTP